MLFDKEMTLQKQLKMYLERYDISAAQLSRKSGVSQQVISLWLKGAEPKKLTQVKKVAEVFRTTVDNLCFGETIQTLNNSEIFLLDQSEWISGIFEIKVRRVK